MPFKHSMTIICGLFLFGFVAKPTMEKKKKKSKITFSILYISVYVSRFAADPLGTLVD